VQHPPTWLKKMADRETIFPGGNYVIAFTGERSSFMHMHMHMHMFMTAKEITDEELSSLPAVSVC
jgi:hypothetical protein